MFMSDVSVIVRHMRVFSERCLCDTGVGYPEQIAVMYLSKYEPTSQDQLVRLIGIDKGAIAKTIAKLQTKGFVHSTVNKLNRREKTLTLTKEGHALLARLGDALALWEQEVYRGITSEERLIIEKSMALMAQNSQAMIERKQPYGNE